MTPKGKNPERAMLASLPPSGSYQLKDKWYDGPLSGFELHSSAGSDYIDFLTDGGDRTVTFGDYTEALKTLREL